MRLFLGGIVIVTATALLLLAARAERSQEVEISLALVRQGPIASKVSARGKLVSARTWDLRVNKPLWVGAIHVAEGDWVKRGQVLVTLRGSQMLDPLADQVRMAQGEYDRLREETALAEELYIAKAISLQQVEEARTRLQRGKVQLEAVRRELEANRELLSASSLPEGRGWVIVAPLEGRVIDQRLPAEGFLDPDAKTPLLILADIRHLQVLAEVSPLDIGRIREGQRVEWVAPFRLEPLRGTVRSIASEVSRGEMAPPGSLGVVQVRCDLAEENQPQTLLKLGMQGDARIFVEERRQTLLVPLEAIQTEGPTRFVFVIENQVARRQVVRVGLTDEQYVEILEGLFPGAWVAVAGTERLQEGVRTKIRRSDG
ncbi:MAG: efflux RND transporter periplasmic adaptor subunit [Nitrospirae bacterium]|nr:efflux RND transporter periplasmic adaptor subunit [Nitrospirota bacterium]